MSDTLPALADAAYDAPAPHGYQQDGADADRWRIGFLVDMADDAGTRITWDHACCLMENAARDVAGEYVRCLTTGNLIPA